MLSCSPTHRLQHLVRKHPELLTKDTLIVRDTTIVPRVSLDTTFFWNSFIDTIRLDTGRLHIKIIKRDSLVEVQGECDTLTIYKEILVPVEKVIIKERSYFEKYGYLYMIMIAILVIGYRLYKNKFK